MPRLIVLIIALQSEISQGYLFLCKIFHRLRFLVKMCGTFQKALKGIAGLLLPDGKTDRLPAEAG